MPVTRGYTAVRRACTHLPLLLPLLLDNPTLTPRTTWQGSMEALTCPFFVSCRCPTGCRCQFILFFFPVAICSLILFGLFLLLSLLPFTLPLPRLLLLPQLPLSLLVLILWLFIGFPLLFGGLRIRHIIDFLLTTVCLGCLVKGLVLLEQRLAHAFPVHDIAPLNIILRVPFPDACL